MPPVSAAASVSPLASISMVFSPLIALAPGTQSALARKVRCRAHPPGRLAHHGAIPHLVFLARVCFCLLIVFSFYTHRSAPLPPPPEALGGTRSPIRAPFWPIAFYLLVSLCRCLLFTLQISDLERDPARAGVAAKERNSIECGGASAPSPRALRRRQPRPALWICTEYCQACGDHQRAGRSGAWRDAQGHREGRA